MHTRIRQHLLEVRSSSRTPRSGVVLAFVELIDATGVHVLGAVIRGAVGQWSQAPGQDIDDGDLHLWEEVLITRRG